MKLLNKNWHIKIIKLFETKLVFLKNSTVNDLKTRKGRTALAEINREGYMDKSKLQLLLKMSDMSLTKFAVISISSFVLQKLYFHLSIISLLNSMEKTYSHVAG